MSKLDYMVYIGRFQPLHNGHLHVLERCFEEAEKVIILLGSSYDKQTLKNPFTDNERIDMLHVSVPKKLHPFCQVIKVADEYSDFEWAQVVEEAVHKVILEQHPESNYVFDEFSIGFMYHPMESHDYLELFPLWRPMEILEPEGTVHSTTIREAMFTHRTLPYEKYVPEASLKAIQELIISPRYLRLMEEHKAIEEFKLPYRELPYPPIFTTVDVYMEEEQGVLLVKRKGHIGKGLWALPGGFVDAHETLENAALRELREETGVVVEPYETFDPILVADSPSRSQLGRVISHVFKYVSLDHPPRLVAGDDAEEVRWWPVEKITRDMMHDDHYLIIKQIQNDLTTSYAYDIH